MRFLKKLRRAGDIPWQGPNVDFDLLFASFYANHAKGSEFKTTKEQRLEWDAVERIPTENSRAEPSLFPFILKARK
jgi:hypothetical protein